MNDLRLETEYDAFYPGTDALVTVFWNWGNDFDRKLAIEVRLVWNTAGKGDRDLGVAQVVRFETADRQGKRDVAFKLPWGPYSFSGKLISLIWALEAVAMPDQESFRKEIIIGPNSEEVLIGAAREAARNSSGNDRFSTEG